MKNFKNYDVIVVGGGIAGLTSAAYMAKSGYTTLVCEKSEKCGGLVGSFVRNGFTFDAGIRAFENSGIVFPMLQQLGIEIDFVDNPVSIGIEDERITLRGKDSLAEYREMLSKLFPENKADINAIIVEIKKIADYMDVLYGIENPLFMDLKMDKQYLFKTLLPWLWKYQINIRKAQKLSAPINTYLQNFTEKQSLIDVIIQHFFENMPTFFALSYFGLYSDYHYPVGGTGILIGKMVDFVTSNHGETAVSTEISYIDSENRLVRTTDGRCYGYGELIWCGDMKALYSAANSEKAKLNTKKKIAEQKKRAILNHGGNSILTVYLSVNLDQSYFESISGAHLFYTPSKVGLSGISSENWKNVMLEEAWSVEVKQKAFKKWISDYLALTTYEISCPVLRDEALAPEGKTGVIVSTLMDYQLVKFIADAGWYEEFKRHCEEKIISVLDASVFPELKQNIQDVFSSTPLTIQRLTGNANGAITGWAFVDNQRTRKFPAINEFRKIAKSVDTPIPHIHQAGQWTFSPSGLPVSILTGKLAADAVCKILAESSRIGKNGGEK